MILSTQTVAYRDRIAEMLEDQASWRAAKAREWPDDERNARSRDALRAAAAFVRRIDSEHPAIRQFAELGRLLEREDLNGGPETISGSYVAGRFCFDNGRRAPGASDFESLLDSMFSETLESWTAYEANNDEALPPLVVHYLNSHGVSSWEWDDDEES